MIALIAAYANNRIIGSDGRIPWVIEGEQKRFKELTTGNVVIMGRRTYEEIGKPLPDRTTIVISNTINIEEKNCTTCSSLTEAIKEGGNRKIYIAGGERLYEEALPLADKMYITEVDCDVKGDTFFPEFAKEDFLKEINARFEGEIPYTYVTYTRKSSLKFVEKDRQLFLENLQRD